MIEDKCIQILKSENIKENSKKELLKLLLLEYINEKNNPVLDMMIQFKSQEADCLFTDFNHMKFNLKKLKKAYSTKGVDLI